MGSFPVSLFSGRWTVRCGIVDLVPFESKAFVFKGIWKRSLMSTESDGPAVNEAVRTLLLLMPRLVGRAKRLPIPPALQGLDLAPRHLALLAHLETALHAYEAALEQAGDQHRNA